MFQAISIVLEWETVPSKINKQLYTSFPIMTFYYFFLPSWKDSPNKCTSASVAEKMYEKNGVFLSIPPTQKSKNSISGNILLPVSGYQIWKKKKGGPWEKVNDYPVTGTNYTVQPLDEGEEYEFKVAAVTDAGVGDESMATAPVLIEDPNCECQF